ncbi:MAG TPA: S8/S53 family peptidase [Nocardioides sp.]|uniref:S8 family peptidase n=1 Tax=Nocardioides sp. TaxID=35761 RepID=UPI002E369001|nr:S8/S53 family peptidase [Nocardioides sp.]HEX5087702.1 S8/S53 family peptidase [Nocardioides sp.]
MATDPAPFSDLHVPPRTPEQETQDRKRNREQTDLLAGKTSATGTRQRSAVPDGKDELDQLLEDRRSDAGSNVVHFTTEPTASRRWSLVVPGELLVRHEDKRRSPSTEADTALNDNGFHRLPPDAAGSEIPRELAGRLSVYTYRRSDESRNQDMRGAMGELATPPGGAAGPAPGGPAGGAPVQVSPHLVTALHIVAKAAVGPAPTQADASDEAFIAAGRRKPQGKVMVAVIDTGIAKANTRTDGWLNEVRRTPGAEGNIDPLDRFPRPKNGFLDFAAGHGTFAAGIVRLVDRDARIRVYRALDSDGFASELAIAAAMIRAVKDGADVLSLSVGMRTVDDRPSVALELALDVIDEIVARRKREAPAVVVSAGNYGDNRPVWPAAFTDRVISVAALNTRMQGAGWSSRGPWVTCSCIGQGIVSTFVPGDEDPAFSKHHPSWPPPDHYPKNAWAVWSGTSFAAPQIAGAISRMMREKGITSPPRAARRLLQRGTPTPNFGRALRLLPGTRT